MEALTIYLTTYSTWKRQGWQKTRCLTRISLFLKISVMMRSHLLLIGRTSRIRRTSPPFRRLRCLNTRLMLLKRTLSKEWEPLLAPSNRLMKTVKKSFSSILIRTMSTSWRKKPQFWSPIFRKLLKKRRRLSRKTSSTPMVSFLTLAVTSLRTTRSTKSKSLSSNYRLKTSRWTGTNLIDLRILIPIKIRLYKKINHLRKTTSNLIWIRTQTIWRWESPSQAKRLIRMISDPRGWITSFLLILDRTQTPI